MSESSANPSCWICLDDKPDKSGKPPVRNCSCRGSDAGFAHVSCIIKYAERKTSEAPEHPKELTRPWVQCPNCKQFYQNQLAIDLLDQCFEYVNEKYSECDWKPLSVLHVKLGTICKQKARREETQKVIEKIVPLIDELEQRVFDLSIPPEGVWSMNADIYGLIGLFLLDYKNADLADAKKGFQYLEMSKDIHLDLGFDDGVSDTEAKIAYFKSIYIEKFGHQEGFGTLESKEEVLERQRLSYQTITDTYGEDRSLFQGSNYATALLDVKRKIEAWRLLTKLVSVSRRFHGCDHHTTKEFQEQLKRCKFQVVAVKNREGKFEAIRYEGDLIVLQGPVLDPRKVSEEETISVNANSILLPVTGAAVVCHGLKNAAYLNGKIGDVRSYNNESERFGVHFEDESIKPKSVKLENLRILFELPDE